MDVRSAAARLWDDEIKLDELVNSGRAVRPRPVVRVPPAFPPRAASCGYEGRCTVIFDLDSSGIPENILPACTSQLFERYASRAVARFQYAPLKIDGVETSYKGVMTVIRFELADWQ